MIALWSSLQFLNLAAFWAALITPLLIFAYLRKDRRKRQVVSSILVLQHLSRKRALHRRFKPPLRFFLELLALLLLVSAAASPFMRTPSSKIALIVDTSLSMQAKTTGGENRFTEAIATAKKWLASRPGDEFYTLYTSAPRLNRISERNVTRADIESLFGKLQASYSADSLELSVLELAEAENFDQVVAVSDVQIDRQNNESLASSPTSTKTALTGLLVGKAVENPYIANAQIANTASQFRITASVALSGQFALPLTISLATRAGKSIASKNVTALPGKLIEVAFEISQGGDSTYRLQLSAPNDRNAIAADDIAWVSGGGGKLLELLLVSPDQPTGDALGLAAIPGFTTTQLNPEQFSERSLVELDRYELIVFHKSAPRELPDRPTLLILPPDRNPAFPVRAEAGSPNVTSWSEDSSITRYMKVPLLRPSAAVVLGAPSWAQPVISVEQGPIVLAGESRGVRYAGVGIELLPFEGKRTAVTSILTLNLFNWLHGEGDLYGDLLAGTSMRLEPGKTWIIKTPAGALETVEVKRDESSFFTLDQPGPYVLSSISPNATKADQAQTRTITANCFFPDESNTFSAHSFLVPTNIAKEQAEADSGQPIWRYIAGFVLALLLFEYLLHMRKNTPGTLQQAEAA